MINYLNLFSVGGVTRANNVRCITRGVENVEHQISEQDASFSNYFLFQAAKKKLYLIKAPREHASYVLLFVLLIGYQIITPSVYLQYFLVKITWPSVPKYSLKMKVTGWFISMLSPLPNSV